MPRGVGSFLKADRSMLLTARIARSRLTRNRGGVLMMSAAVVKAVAIVRPSFGSQKNIFTEATRFLQGGGSPKGHNHEEKLRGPAAFA